MSGVFADAHKASLAGQLAPPPSSTEAQPPSPARPQQQTGTEQPARQVAQQVAKILGAFVAGGGGGGVGEIGAEASLVGLGLDSIDWMEIVARLNRRFKTRATAALMTEVRTVGDLVRWVERHAKAAAAPTPTAAAATSSNVSRRAVLVRGPGPGPEAMPSAAASSASSASSALAEQKEQREWRKLLSAAEEQSLIAIEELGTEKAILERRLAARGWQPPACCTFAFGVWQVVLATLLMSLAVLTAFNG